MVPTRRQHRRSKESARRSDNPLTAGMMSLSRSFISLLGPGLAIALAIWRPSILGEADLRLYDALVRADAAVTDTGTRAVVVAIDEDQPDARRPMAMAARGAGDAGRSASRARRLGRRAGSAAAGSRTRGCGHRSRARARSEPGARRHRLRVPLRSAGRRPTRARSIRWRWCERQRGDAPPSAGLLKAANGVCTLSDLVGAAGGSGFINAGYDPDGLLRRASAAAAIW